MSVDSVPQEIINELGFGVVPNLFAEADLIPETQTALWKAFRHTVMRGTLPRSIKEMMGIIVSKEAGSDYAAGVHLHALTLQGVEAPVLAALARGEVPKGMPEKTAALLRFAHSVARHPHDPEQVKLLDGVGLSDAETREAVAVVAVFRMVNTWTDLLDIPLDAL